MDTERIAFDRFKYAIQNRISMRELIALDKLKLEVRFDYLLNMMILQLRADLLRGKFYGDVHREFCYFDNWFEHFKDRWIPNCLRKYICIRKEKFTYVERTICNVCPHHGTEFGGKNNGHIEFLTTKIAVE